MNWPGAVARKHEHASPPLFDAFDRIRIINLATRRDRRAQMVRELKKFGLWGDPRVAFFPGLVMDNPGPFARVGSHGAFLSRLSILQEAARDGASVLVLEDDCTFLRPAIDLYRLPSEWDIFYGGYKASDPENPSVSDIIGSHFMGFSARACRIAHRYLTEYLKADFEPDAQAAAEPHFNPRIRPPTDGALVWLRRAHPELVTEFAMLGVQRPSRTDIGDQHPLDRLPLIRNGVEFIRSIRNRLMGPKDSSCYGKHEK